MPFINLWEEINKTKPATVSVDRQRFAIRLGDNIKKYGLDIGDNVIVSVGTEELHGLVRVEKANEGWPLAPLGGKLGGGGYEGRAGIVFKKSILGRVISLPERFRATPVLIDAIPGGFEFCLPWVKEKPTAPTQPGITEEPPAKPAPGPQPKPQPQETEYFTVETTKKPLPSIIKRDIDTPVPKKQPPLRVNGKFVSRKQPQTQSGAAFETVEQALARGLTVNKLPPVPRDESGGVPVRAKAGQLNGGRV